MRRLKGETRSSITCADHNPRRSHHPDCGRTGKAADPEATAQNHARAEEATVQLDDILDEYDVRPQNRRVSTEAECDHLHVRYCHMHRSHREFLLRHEMLARRGCGVSNQTGT